MKIYLPYSCILFSLAEKLHGWAKYNLQQKICEETEHTKHQISSIIAEFMPCLITEIGLIIWDALINQVGLLIWDGGSAMLLGYDLPADVVGGTV